MNKEILIFGIGGQDGFYLKDICEQQGYTVIGISRSAGNWIQGSVADQLLVNELVKKHQPYCIFHLAANSSTRHNLIYENNETICKGSINILEAVYQHSRHTKVFLSGSGLQFVNKGQPISESDDFFAGSPYAAQRIYSTYLSRYYNTLGVRSYVGYFFHHDSPLRPELHLNIKIIKAALRIAAGSDEWIEIGNPDVIKEFNHAEDLMKAIWILVNQDKVTEAVIGSGTGYSIWNLVEVCEQLIGISLKERIRINSDYTAEFQQLTCNPSLIKSLGWQPAHNISSLVQSIIDAKSNQ